MIVATPEEVERYPDSHSVIITPCLRGGRVVYTA